MIESWMSSISSCKVPFYGFAPEHVKLEDIAWANSMNCRFAGHITEFYSVAQHSVWVWKRVREDGGTIMQQKQALMHDASEAYLGDVVAPFKREMREYKAIEERFEAIITAAFGLYRELPPLVKKWDRVASFVEANQWSPMGTKEWGEWGDWHELAALQEPIISLGYGEEPYKQFMVAAELLGIHHI